MLATLYPPNPHPSPPHFITPRQLVFLPPGGAACVTSFLVTGKHAVTGRQLPRRNVTAGLAVTYGNLTAGATYNFTVAATNGAKGAGAAAVTRVTLPPGLLDAKPGPPEKLRAVAVNATAAKVRGWLHLGVWPLA